MARMGKTKGGTEMSNFEKRVKRARRRDMRKWCRAFKYCRDFGSAVLGACAVWLFAAVALS